MDDRWNPVKITFEVEDIADKNNEALKDIQHFEQPNEAKKALGNKALKNLPLSNRLFRN
jgi:hypothetical protein